MKKLFVLIGAVVLLASCVTQNMPSYKDVSIVDYKKYWDQGFFITESPAVGFDYIPIGAVSATVADGYEPVANETPSPKKTGWASRSIRNTSGTTKSKEKLVSYTLYDAIDMAVAKAKENGADGLINVFYEASSVTTSEVTSYGSGTSYTGKGRSYTVKGMAVKRK